MFNTFGVYVQKKIGLLKWLNLHSAVEWSFEGGEKASAAKPLVLMEGGTENVVCWRHNAFTSHSIF